MNMDKIRNFSIIAHIDHGKSTLADRILDICGNVTDREKKAQLLDNMDIERERGITIKLNAVELKYKGYTLHLIDTPGHVDFSYEVSRSLAACEGAILVVDATQGIEAQTLANLYLALENDLTIIPVINKIDLPNADPERVKDELVKTIGFDRDEILCVSGKTGEGVDALMDAIIERVPAPKSTSSNLRALIFDSYFDSYKGIVALIKVVDGEVKIKDKIKMISTGAVYEVTSLGKTTPKDSPREMLSSGEVGYLTASIKSIEDVRVGDTIILDGHDLEALPGYKPMKPMVYSGIFPIDSSKYGNLKEALMKLKLNDAALTFEPEKSDALGFGFRCGFLGLLHMEIVEERIEREFNIELIATSPSVIYEVELNNGEIISIDSPNKMPDASKIKCIKEPFVKTNVFVPNEYVGSVMELCQDKRGIYKNVEYIDEKRVNVIYELPLSEIVYDFFDKLKSFTKGYASFDYEFIGNKESKLVKLDILLNGEIVDALSIIVHKDDAYKRGKVIVENLKKIIPRQMFTVPIQASIGSRVIARETLSAMKKNVLAKCYGGDVSRKRKLLEKQKEGKKRMKQVGSVEVPQEAFLSVLSVDKKE
ncbi:MAG: translation elongation factor 4 [Tenericutes bacterium]|nr:translation elongation factor 4 [Mycoplasmatota bacterium]